MAAPAPTLDPVALLFTHHGAVRGVTESYHQLTLPDGRSVLVDPPCANMTCFTYPREISEQRGRYDDQPTDKGPDAISARIGAAAELRARFNLKTPDALHLAAAQCHGCEALWTHDNRLDQASRGLATILL